MMMTVRENCEQISLSIFLKTHCWLVVGFQWFQSIHVRTVRAITATVTSSRESHNFLVTDEVTFLPFSHAFDGDVALVAPQSSRHNLTYHVSAYTL